MSGPTVRRARDVADLRTWLVAELDATGRLGRSLARAEEFLRKETHQHPRFNTMEPLLPTSRDVEQRHLRVADLWYVPDEAVDVLVEAAASVPSDVRLEQWQMPSESGFAVFEKPVYGKDTQEQDRVLKVSGVLWGPLNIWDEDEQRAVKAIGIASWHQVNDRTRDWAELDAEKMVVENFWVPLGRSDWEIGTTIVEHPQYYQRGGRLVMDSVEEDRRLVCALWGLALAAPQESVDHADRPMRKRAERAGITASSSVRVLTFPRAITSPRSDASTGRHVQVRFMVRGHWRRQACGPNRSEHRHVYIAPHWRGPEDAPLSNPATVVKRLRG